MLGLDDQYGDTGNLGMLNERAANGLPVQTGLACGILKL